jgi:F-type H+-transporting ATPase subunit delta
VATAAAKRYAKALFDLAQQDRDFDRWARRLAAVRELLADPEIAAVLSNPTIATEQREAVISPSGGDFDTEAANLTKLLVESGRIEDAADIEEQFSALADEAAGRVRAKVTTAIALPAHDRDRITDELAKRLNKEVRLTLVVDPRILGGLKVQFGDRLIDATVATRLQQLRRRLATS